MMMAEQGAKVIKVEPMNLEIHMRYIGANKGGISSLFATAIGVSNPFGSISKSLRVKN
jgi:crotonobetainyl-CoA:carnitine CoA-transferase CaiB-like acyl-CoA transferase